MTRGVSKIDPCVGLGTPLGCADGARLIWGVKHKRWAPPGVKVCGDAAVTCSCELLQRAEAIVVESQSVVPVNDRLYGVRPQGRTYHSWPASLRM